MSSNPKARPGLQLDSCTFIFILTPPQVCDVFHVFCRISLCCAHFAVHELFLVFEKEVAYVNHSHWVWYCFVSV